MITSLHGAHTSDLIVLCHTHCQMASYSCIAEFFSEPDSMAYLGFLCENLEGDTNALQAFLGESCTISFFLHIFNTSFSPPSFALPVQRTHSYLCQMWHMLFVHCQKESCWMVTDWSARLKTPEISCYWGSTRWVYGCVGRCVLCCSGLF